MVRKLAPDQSAKPGNATVHGCCMSVAVSWGNKMNRPSVTFWSVILKSSHITAVWPEDLYIPDAVDTSNPEDLFKLCDSNNEYTEVLKDNKPVMYKYYNNIRPVDFYKMVAILIHVGYERIPRLRIV